MDELTYQPRDHVSISSLTTASRCLRKFYYDKMGLSEGRSLPLLFGGALHEAIPTALTEGLDEAMEIFSESFQPEETDDRRNIQRAEKMLSDFVNKPRVFELVQPPEELRPSQEGVSPWEMEFSLDIGLRRGEQIIPLIGKIDSLALYQPTGGEDLFAVEYKTSSEVSNRLIGNLALAPQIIGYPFVLKKLGVDVKGTIAVVLRVSTNREETAVIPHWVDGPQLRAFERWARWTGEWILQCEEQGVWPQNLGACSPYPAYEGQAGRRCPFYSLCHECDDWTELAHQFIEDEERISL